jgi:hypothetical protein
MNFSNEVLIYIQTLKNFLKTNKEANIYFLSNVNEEEFFDNLSKIAQNNFEKNGEPNLTVEQFEFLRGIMVMFNEIEKQEEIFIFTFESKNIKYHYK